MKRSLVLLFLLCCIFSLGAAVAAEPDEDIIVLYTNDVHCAVDDGIGYAGLASYKSEMAALYGHKNVTLVDGGNAIQGDAIGTLSRGLFPIEIMNETGYDIVTFGNHEFDYGLDRMFELMERHRAPVISCNFVDLSTNKPVFEPYVIVDYGETKIAYIGITTPNTLFSSMPSLFRDSNGNLVYSFCEGGNGTALYDSVQIAVNSATAKGADIIIAVGHCGVGSELSPWESTDIIANTTGIDAFIDGHSRNAIKGDVYKNKYGEEVLLTSAGTGLSMIGKLVISPDGLIASDLISNYSKKDRYIEDFIKIKKYQSDALLNAVVAKSEFPLIIEDPTTGNRLIRNSETNLGNLVADAYREVLDSDIAVINSGDIRAGIYAGEVTYGDIIAVHPLNNTACVVEASGQEILDLLEMGARNTPSESGGFVHVSGLTYEIHTYIESSVKLDDNNSLHGVEDQYRVRNVMVGNKPLNLNKVYTLSSNNELIKNGGGGYPGFMDNRLVLNDALIDNQVLITYIVDRLGGVVPEEYGNIYGQGRITIRHSPFIDLAPGAWYLDPVGYVYQRGIMGGTTADTFSPDASISRASFITTLYRQAGSPEIEGKASGLFRDCKDDSWYSDAIVWAAKNNIVTRASGSTFMPNSALVREDMAVFLYRHIQRRGGGFSDKRTDISEFTDKEDISISAAEAVSFCAQNGIITGLADGSYAPKEKANRAMAAAVIQRYEEFLVAKEFSR